MSIRNEIVDALKRELIGPAPGLPAIQLNREEILAPVDTPRLRYGAGILFPSKVVAATQEDGADTAESEEDGDSNPDSSECGPNSTGESDPLSDERGDTQVENDLEVNRSNEFLPSAMGITMLADIPEKLVIDVSAAQYEAVVNPRESFKGKDGKAVKRSNWCRIPLNQPVEINQQELLGPGPIEVPLKSANTATALALHIYSRPGYFGGAETNPNTRFLTITLINRTEGTGYAGDADCFYQCGISVRGANDEDCFLTYPEKTIDSNASPEDQSLALLYRHRKVFAVGHGCAANWGDNDSREDRCSSVWSESLPTYEVKPIVPSSLDGVNLKMVDMAYGSTSAAIQSCEELADRYESWINVRQQEAEDENNVPAFLKTAADENIGACCQCLKRIRRGIELLRSSERALTAFTLMNKAMLMQHEHYQLATDSKHKRKWVKSSIGLAPERAFEVPDYLASKRQWRPFQLAFVLMTIRSIVLDEKEDLSERDIVDLIWFPTGGGKTEAYLGLAAFTIFYRRLTDPNNAGTTVLMRYTLRLLTTQQYQRAASLICAGEKLRREYPSTLGEAPITIGLWVGGSVTPNKERNAVESLNRLSGGDKENPFIIMSCPWCGVQMGPIKEGRRTRVKGYRKFTRPARVRLICEDLDCEFNQGEGLPLQIIDEHIYQSPPTLLVGTVDKFAMMPWNPDSRSLFGIDREVVSPPDLIIQDELHLISGPLGSMVGHYETIIDALTERDTQQGTIRAKIIASTATISRADDQVRRLYGGRKSCLFPPQGLIAGDSFFAEEDNIAAGRLYCGIFATGLPSQTTTQVRVLASLLQTPMTIDVADLSARDPYWTLMVYFNSIRELGHAATLIKADIPEYMNVICRRLGLSKLWSDEAGEKRRWINADMELTSRVQNSEITEYMDRLFSPYPGKSGEQPVDVCLATNMIQVGLDVSRLSLMSIIGQPKTTSEYIQASSRVGRSADGPGLVITILSPAKPRDRSHVEHFRSFHQSIYRHVEPTSVTPFALPVAERALHALVITLARFWGGAEQRKKPQSPSGELEMRIRKTILDRVENVEPEESARVKLILDDIFDRWGRLPTDTYGSFRPPENEVPMMYPSGTHPDDAWDHRAYQTPSSMRNIDASCSAKVFSNYPD